MPYDSWFPWNTGGKEVKPSVGVLNSYDDVVSDYSRPKFCLENYKMLQAFMKSKFFPLDPEGKKEQIPLDFTMTFDKFLYAVIDSEAEEYF